MPIEREDPTEKIESPAANSREWLWISLHLLLTQEGWLVIAVVLTIARRLTGIVRRWVSSLPDSTAWCLSLSILGGIAIFWVALVVFDRGKPKATPASDD